MCAVCGILAPRSIPEPAAEVGRMLELLSHRGPDGRGQWSDPGVTLGHARLQLVGGENGHQPIVDESGRIVLVCAGEIFNHKELRASLEKKGHRFRTASDCEVMLHIFEEEGTVGFTRLNGQWAAAIWDGRVRKLYLTRDRFGIAPLFYRQEGSTFRFASEIKAFFADDHFTARPDPYAFDQWLRFWTPVPGRTFFEGVSEVRPGHVLEVDGSTITERPYWTPTGEPFGGADENEASSRLRELLDDSVRLRLGTPERVAIYLSGGLDSSAVAESASRAGRADLECFHANLDAGRLNEDGPFARDVATRLGLPLHAIRYAPATALDHLDRMVWHTEEPFIRAGALPFERLSEAAHHAGVKAVLTGEGADELFLGYDVFLETRLREYASRPGSRRTLRRRLALRLYPEVFEAGRKDAGAFWVDSFFPESSLPGDPFFSHAVRWSKAVHLRRYLSKPLLDRLASYDPTAELEAALPKNFRSYAPVERAQQIEIALFLPKYLLSVQGDRAGMAHSVETRHPFLDHRIAEFALGLPRCYKQRGLHGKRILRQACRGKLPEAVLSRRKRPYRTPTIATEADWERIMERLNPAAVRRAGLFDPEAVAFLANKARGGGLGEIEGMALDAVLSGQAFHEVFVARGRASGAIS